MSKTAAKLEIHGALNARSSETIGRLAKQLADPAAFGAWAELCRRDAVYITALTRVQRDARKTTKKTATPTPTTPEF